MTKKEYQKIMEKLNERSFYHDFSSVTENEIEKESIQVVPLQDVFSILRKHVKKRRKKVRFSILSLSSIRPLPFVYWYISEK